MSRQKLTPGTDRSLRTDSRGVSEVIGAILIFGLIVTLLVLIQANAVPAANKQVEFEHNQRVIQDFQTLQGELYQVGTTGDPASATVETGVVYPNRFFLLNPSPAVGSLRTSDPLSVTITNARAEGNPGDYWNSSDISFTTRGLVYTPRYNELRNPGTKYWEHSMLFSRYDNDNVYFDDPTAFIDGRQIRLTLVDGRLSGGGLSTSVEIAPISTGSRTLTVANESEPITLTLETTLSGEEWNSTLQDEPYARVVDPTIDDGTVTIELNETQSYDLRISKVRVGTNIAQQPGPRYITDIEGNGTSVPENTSQRLVVEVRDEYNNPVSNVKVTATDEQDEPVPSLEGSRTDSDGLVTFRYVAPENVDGNKDIRVQTSMGDGTDAGNSTDPLENATFDLTVVDSDASGSPPSGNTTEDGVSSINPGDDDDIVLVGVCSPSSTSSTLYFQNRGSSTTLEQARLLFHQGQKVVDEVYISHGDGDSTTLPAGGFFTDLEDPVSLPADSIVAIDLSSGSPGLSQHDLVGLSFQLTDSRSNYFITVRELELGDFECP